MPPAPVTGAHRQVQALPGGGAATGASDDDGRSDVHRCCEAAGVRVAHAA
eukprot:CAMPEP_0179327226 /NCGR_PEP_ID=MMETSP0797-20121207/61845_1 /TAXON_ID=47934 /ORGANISM="Dinophysis acuminata, Strain DAEP01" /LENGTH=49 /DNA_ID= /DNA_START= /DNA_END= /DNA_ORIENTATION=